MSYLIAFVIGTAIGAGMSCLLLSESLLVKYQKTNNTISNNYAAAKAVYNAEIYGTDTDEESEDETE